MDRKLELGAQKNVNEIPRGQKKKKKKDEIANQSNKLGSLPAIALGRFSS